VRSKKLTNILKIITDNLTQERIPYSLIGALTLSLYGLPRFTADIDLLTETRFWSRLSPIMQKLGYTSAIPAAKRFNLFKLLQITKNSLRRKL